MSSISIPDVVMGDLEVKNDTPTSYQHPQMIDQILDRICTGCRRAGEPVCIGRPITSETEWEHTIRVPPYTEAIGLAMIGKIHVSDATDPGAEVRLWISDDGITWDRYISLTAAIHGYEWTAEYTLAVLQPDKWVRTIDHPAGGSAFNGLPMSVTASDEPQDLVVYLKTTTTLVYSEDWEINAYAFHIVPFRNEGWPSI